jgi:hypothetical protein
LLGVDASIQRAEYHGQVAPRTWWESKTVIAVLGRARTLRECLAAGSDSQKISKSLLHTKYAVWMCAVVRGETVAMAHRGAASSCPNAARSIRGRCNRSHRSTHGASILVCAPPAPTAARLRAACLARFVSSFGHIVVGSWRC